MDQVVSVSLNIIAALADFYNSTFFDFIKFILGIYAAVLFVDIILLLVQRGFSGDYRNVMFGMNIPKELVKVKHKNKLRSKWEALKEKLKSENMADWEAAVLEADVIIDDLIARMDYPGAHMEERLASIPKGQIDNMEALKEAHEIKKRIVQDKDFKLDRVAAENAVLSYEHFLRLFEVLD